MDTIAVHKNREYLSNVLHEPVALMGLVETLAYIEFLGAKWIMCVPPEKFGTHVIEHASDELRHGQMLSGIARKMRGELSPALMQSSHPLVDKALALTERYTKKLFLRTTRPVMQSLPPELRGMHYYYLLSFVIERRLMSIYPHLAKGESVLAEAIRSIIADERKHLTGVTAPSRAAEAEYALDLERIIEAEEVIAAEWLAQLAELFGVANENRVNDSRVGRPLSVGQVQALA